MGGIQRLMIKRKTAIQKCGEVWCFVYNIYSFGPPVHGSIWVAIVECDWLAQRLIPWTCQADTRFVSELLFMNFHVLQASVLAVLCFNLVSLVKILVLLGLYVCMYIYIIYKGKFIYIGNPKSIEQLENRKYEVNTPHSHPGFLKIFAGVAI